MLNDKYEDRSSAGATEMPNLQQPEVASAPPNSGGGVTAWFAAFQRPIFHKNLAIKACIGLAVIVLGQQVVIQTLSINSGPKPYFVEHDEKSGAVWVSTRYASTYTPTSANRRYFLVQWAQRVYTISPDTSDTLRNQIPAAAAWTIGDATKELETLVTVTDPIAERVVKEPGLTRVFEENATSFSPDGHTAYMIFTTTESVGGQARKPRQQLLTINFVEAPESLKPGEEKTNPLGTRISHFVSTPYTGINPGGA